MKVTYDVVLSQSVAIGRDPITGRLQAVYPAALAYDLPTVAPTPHGAANSLSRRVPGRRLVPERGGLPVVRRPDSPRIAAAWEAWTRARLRDELGLTIARVEELFADWPIEAGIRDLHRMARHPEATETRD